MTTFFLVATAVLLVAHWLLALHTWRLLNWKRESNPVYCVVSDMASRNCDYPDDCRVTKPACLPCRARWVIDR